MLAFDILASLFASALAAMGVGGGGLLIIYLVLILGMPQESARALNLVFFLVSALVSLPIHHAEGKVKWRKATVFAFSGAIGAGIGCALAEKASSVLLKKIFGWFIIFAGSVTLFKQAKKLIRKIKTKSLKKGTEKDG